MDFLHKPSYNRQPTGSLIFSPAKLAMNFKKSYKMVTLSPSTYAMLCLHPFNQEDLKCRSTARSSPLTVSSQRLARLFLPYANANCTAASLLQPSAALVPFQQHQLGFPPAINVNSALGSLTSTCHFGGKLSQISQITTELEQTFR